MGQHLPQDEGEPQAARSKPKAVRASSLRGGFSAPLPKNAKVIPAPQGADSSKNSAPTGRETPAEWAKRERASKRTAAWVSYQHLNAIGRNPRARFVTPTFAQHPTGPIDLTTSPKADKGDKRKCRQCGKLKGINAFPPGRRPGSRKWICEKCLRKTQRSKD